MGWNRSWGKRESTPLPVWAGLCEGLADGTNSQYPAGARHALLVMVRYGEKGPEAKMRRLLAGNGWSNSVIMRVKRLDQPFLSDDPTMLACYTGAMEKECGIIVYEDPMHEGDILRR